MSSCGENSFSFYVRTAHEYWIEDLGEDDVFGGTLDTGLRQQLPSLRAVLPKFVEYTSTRDVLFG